MSSSSKNGHFLEDRWFFYWQMSPALWRDRLVELGQGKTLLLPLNWSLHLDPNRKVDFGQYRPETALAKLIMIAQEVGHRPVILLPMAPLPFLPNGGVPAHLAKYPLVDESGMRVAVNNPQGGIHKLYSYYQDSLGEGFKKLVFALSAHLKDNDLATPIVGLNPGHLTQGGHWEPYFKDCGEGFTLSLNRYCEQQKKSGEFESEAQSTDELRILMESLYHQIAEDYLKGMWRGTVRVTYLGGDTLDLFPRSSEYWEEFQVTIDHVMESYTRGALPTTVLLPDGKDRDLLVGALSDFQAQSDLEQMLGLDYYGDENPYHYGPLSFFKVVEKEDTVDGQLTQLGFFDYIARHFRWGYELVNEVDLRAVEDEASKIYFFNARKNLEEEYLSLALKLFMNHQTVLLDESLLNRELKQRLNLFFSENALEIEEITLMTKTLCTRLGEARLIVYDGEGLAQKSKKDCALFWEKILNFLNLKQVQVKCPAEVGYFWKTRAPKATELKYHEVRRGHFYNQSSYKMRVECDWGDFSSFLGMSDPKKKPHSSSSKKLSFELLPGERTCLTFGIYNR